MTAEAVKQVFSSKIEDGKIILRPNMTVEVETFAALFSAASDNPTYDELVAIDGGKLGYISFFDQCKAEGILN